MVWTYLVGILFRSNISRNQSEIAIFFPFSGLKSLLPVTLILVL